MVLLGLSIIIIIVGLIVTIAITLINWSSHITCGRLLSNFGYATYKHFKHEFSKRVWAKSIYGNILHSDPKSNIAEYTIEFNGIGMIMKTPWDYLMMKYFIWQFTKKRANYKWEIKQDK